ncbi:MAG: hypothetical protein IIB46_06620 [Nitrospinae bacterium]|nr:hypothetical protein [Nitrospinota bacterium]
MPRKPTLQNVIDNLIRESQSPFTVEDFSREVEKRWRKKMSKTSLSHLKRKLSDHKYIIGTDANDYLPYSAVLEKIQHIPLLVHLGKFEIDRKILIPGHRMIPFISNDHTERDLIFLDPDGEEIPRLKKKFYIEEVIHFYQYAGESHFPDDINVNEWMPGKSLVMTPAWDMRKLFSTYKCKPKDGLLIKLVDYARGAFQIQPLSKSQVRSKQLNIRFLNVALESSLIRLYGGEELILSSLEKQILRAFFSLEEKFLNAPAFSLTDFLESLKELSVVSFEGGKVQLVPKWKSEAQGLVKEETGRNPKGVRGSLEEIFQDLGLPFHEWEFISILYTVMASEKFKIESVFNLLFGGQGELFLNKQQHDAFYQKLRELLHVICEDLKQPESSLIRDLRDKSVGVKLSLIGMLRFLEENKVGLQDLPSETLNQIIDLDHFCTETLRKFADRTQPPDLKFIRDVRLALKIILPHLGQLEDEVFSRLGFF